MEGLLNTMDFAMRSRDEAYIIDLCDRALNLVAKRQHKFDFLRGDLPRKGGKGRKLPVDAFYPEINLAIEYRERQHSESVPFFDKPERLTCSGCGRAEQRALYDQRRRDVLLQHGIHLIELDCHSFSHDGQKRLRRIKTADESIVRQQLSCFLADFHE